MNKTSKHSIMSLDINCFNSDSFKNGTVKFEINIQPVSLQNKTEKKRTFKAKIQEITSKSEYIISNTAWVHIEYYCSHIKRLKNPGVYDMDNIVKPILDSICGINGIILDDVLVDRITINWIDSDTERIEITTEYPDLSYNKKKDLIIIKSPSNWCYPINKTIYESKGISDLILSYFDIWESIKSEDDYYKNLGMLPIQNFIYFSKLRESGFEFIDLIRKNEIEV